MIDFRPMDRIALFSHIRPDGDTLGSMFGLRAALVLSGKKVDCFCDGVMPDDLAYLDEEHIYNKQTIPHYDVCIALDCAGVSRLGEWESLFFSCKNTYNIDHHLSNPEYAKFNYVRDSASTCELVYDLLIQNGFVIDKKTAMSLYTGLITDTGSFSQANTTAHTHAVAAALLQVGVDVEWLHNRLMKVVKREKLMLIADRISALRAYEDGQISLMTVTRGDLERFGLGVEDTEGLINYALNIEGVKIAGCIMECGRELFKVSLRCRKGYNVAAVAADFGGGGHTQASGCQLNGLLEEVVERIESRCRIALDEKDGRNR